MFNERTESSAVNLMLERDGFYCKEDQGLLIRLKYSESLIWKVFLSYCAFRAGLKSVQLCFLLFEDDESGVGRELRVCTKGVVRVWCFMEAIVTASAEGSKTVHVRHETSPTGAGQDEKTSLGSI